MGIDKWIPGIEPPQKIKSLQKTGWITGLEPDSPDTKKTNIAEKEGGQEGFLTKDKLLLTIDENKVVYINGKLTKSYTVDIIPIIDKLPGGPTIIRLKDIPDGMPWWRRKDSDYKGGLYYLPAGKNLRNPQQITKYRKNLRANQIKKWWNDDNYGIDADCELPF